MSELILATFNLGNFARVTASVFVAKVVVY